MNLFTEMWAKGNIQQHQKQEIHSGGQDTLSSVQCPEEAAGDDPVLHMWLVVARHLRSCSWKWSEGTEDEGVQVS